MSKKSIFIFAAVFLLTISAFGQTPKELPTPRPSPKPAEIRTTIITDEVKQLPKSPSFSTILKPLSEPTIETILIEAEKQTVVYRENFNNILAEETKTFEEYKKDGKLKNSRTIESNFLAYQSAKETDSVVEYRNVTKVDGKTVGDNDKRTQDFFEGVLKSATAEQELKKIQQESSRYDKNLDISGLTLNQAPVLLAHIRPFFDFQQLGKETIGGSEVFIIGYKQKSKSPYVIFNDEKAEPDDFSIGFEVDLPDSIKEANALLRGKLWIDAKTFQLLREERELTIQPDGLNAPLTVIKTDFEYEKSNLEIVLPKKITLVDYAVKRKDKEITAVQDTRVVFAYSKFTKSDVDVKSGDVKN